MELSPGQDGPAGLLERARALAWLGQNESAADDLTVYDVAMLGRLPHQGWMAPPSESTAANGRCKTAPLRAPSVRNPTGRIRL